MDCIRRKLLWLTCFLLVIASGWSAPADLDEPEYPNDDNYAMDEDEDSKVEEVYTGPPPEILSQGQVIDVDEGRDVFLPCDVRNADSFAVLWKLNATVLWIDSSKMSQDKRLQRYPNNTIHIRHVQSNDSGNYLCNIPSNPAVEIIHVLNVVVPAKIVKRIPEEQTKIIMKGEALTLACEATGTPVPTVTWTRHGNRAFLNGNHKMVGNSLTFENVDRHSSGEYQCIAKNKFGEDTATFQIRVHYAPEVEIAEETVITNVALEPEITCTVHADPPAKVVWYMKGHALKTEGSLNISNNGNKHTLLIKGMQNKDFGAYTCHASNSLGSGQKTVILSGAPSKPKIKVSYSDSDQLPQVKWTVESHLPVKRYYLRYQAANLENKDLEVLVSDKEGNIYYGKAYLSDIMPGESTVSVLAENDYGLSAAANFTVTSGDYQYAQALSAVVSGAPSSSGRPTIIVSIVAVTSIAKLLV